MTEEKATKSNWDKAVEMIEKIKLQPNDKNYPVLLSMALDQLNVYQQYEGLPSLVYEDVIHQTGETLMLAINDLPEAVKAEAFEKALPDMAKFVCEQLKIYR